MNRVYNRRWLRFAKGGKMKYIGHLDLLRVFQSAIRRAALPIAYSMGFNPHQLISFALPLPVGMDSVCEYIELMFEEKDNPALGLGLDLGLGLGNGLLARLDAELPDGLRLLASYEIPERAPRPAAAVSAADYRLVFPGVEDSRDYLQDILAAPEIIVTKKSKSGEKEADIRQDILALDYDPVGAVTMRLSAGSVRNLKPILVAERIFALLVKPFSIHELSITRQELYGTGTEGQLAPLHDIV